MRNVYGASAVGLTFRQKQWRLPWQAALRERGSAGDVTAPAPGERPGGSG